MRKHLKWFARAHRRGDLTQLESPVPAAKRAPATVSSSGVRRLRLVIGRLPGETSCLTLVWAVLDRASRGWRGLTMTAGGLRMLQDLRRSLLDPPRQLRPRTVAASQDGDAPENVSAIA